MSASAFTTGGSHGGSSSSSSSSAPKSGRHQVANGFVVSSSAMLPSPPSSAGGNSPQYSPVNKGQTAMEIGHNAQPQSCFISISSPAMDSLEIRHRPQKQAKRGAGKCGKSKWLLVGIAAILLVAAFGTCFAFCAKIYMEMQDLKEYQQDIYGAQSMELASLKRHLNWLSIKHEEAQSKMQRMDTEMGKLREEMAKLREKQQKDAVQASNPMESSTSTSGATASTNPKGYGDFVVYVNGQPISGREFLAKQHQQMQMQGGGDGKRV